jgi:hypothetical protein
MRDVYTMKEIRKSLKEDGVKITRRYGTLNGKPIYKAVGGGFNPETLYKKSDLERKLWGFED